MTFDELMHFTKCDQLNHSASGWIAYSGQVIGKFAPTPREALEMLLGVLNFNKINANKTK